MSTKFYCSKKECAKKESETYILELPEEAVMDDSNVAHIFCPRCKSVLTRINPDSPVHSTDG